ncbi:MAG: hypothetical protein M1814_003548 [Vezdaea aestivalis]|nr:MAG: hypothetical protein M1814_003548 [Vezdaea aestivalis]
MASCLLHKPLGSLSLYPHPHNPNSSEASPSHTSRPRPGRRRRVKRSYVSSSSALWCTLILVLSCFSTISLAQQNPRDPAYLLSSTLERLAKRGEILIDRRPPPLMRRLEPRQGGSPFANTVTLSNPSANAPTPSSVLTPTTREPGSSSRGTATTPTVKGTSSSSSIAIDPSVVASPAPTAFDTSLGNNFTASTCPSFFSDFLGNRQFQACLPFSLLLQNSNSFFQASKQFTRVSQALDSTCNVVFNKCLPLMADLARNIKADNNCGQDFRLQNPIVLQAYNGFLAYQPLYQAGCLKSPTGSYCFADAITNTSSPTDSYVYFLPLGVALPGGSRPTCNKCLAETMQIFQSSAGNATLPISNTYVEAAQQIQRFCGPTFVNSNVVMKGAAPSSASSPILATLVLVFTLFQLI